MGVVDESGENYRVKRERKKAIGMGEWRQWICGRKIDNAFLAHFDSDHEETASKNNVTYEKAVAPPPHLYCPIHASRLCASGKCR